MTSEVPTHQAGAGPAEPPDQYTGSSPWPGPHAEELDPTRVAQSPSGTVTTNSPPGMPGTPGMFGVAPPAGVPQYSSQEFPTYQAAHVPPAHAAVPPQPVSPPAGPPPQPVSPPAGPPLQMAAQQAAAQQVPPQPVGGQHLAPPAVPAQAVPPQAVPPQGVPAPAGAAPATPSGTSTPDTRAAGRAHVPDSALLPAHHLPPLPPPVPRVYGRAATDAPEQPPPAQQPQTQHPAVQYPPAQHPATPHPAMPQTPVDPTSAPPEPSYPHQAAAPHVAEHPVGPNSPGNVYASTGTSHPPASTFPPFAAPQPMAQPTSPAGFATPPPFGQPFGAPPYQPAEPARPDAPPAGFPAQPAPVTPPPGPDGYQRPPEQSRSQTVMLISVGLVVLLAVVGLIAFTWPRDDNSASATFPVGACVKESPEGRPVEAACADAGAYRVVSQESSKDECPDQHQPHIDLGSGDKRILCLLPAGEADAAGDNPSATD